MQTVTRSTSGISALHRRKRVIATGPVAARQCRPGPPPATSTNDSVVANSRPSWTWLDRMADMNIPPKNLSSPIRELWVNEGALASRPLLLFDTDQHYSSIGNNAGRTRDRERRSEAFFGRQRRLLDLHVGRLHDRPPLVDLSFLIGRQRFGCLLVARRDHLA